MNEFPLWSDTFGEANLAIISVTAAFLAWWVTGKSPALSAFLCNAYGRESGLARQIYMKRTVGMLGFGMLPLVLMYVFYGRSGADYGLALRFPPAFWYWAIGLSAVLAALSIKNAGHPEHLEQYPEIRTRVWSKSLLAGSMLSWMGYLLAYEVMFRGVLLFSCSRAWDVPTAVIINTVIYSLTHLPKSLKEGIGAIPLGILMCYITLQTGAIWAAVLAHWTLSLVNEWYSLKYHPEIALQKA